MTQAARPPVWLISPSTPSCMIDITQHTLKGQKLCKLSGFLKLLPLQGALLATHKNPGRCPGLRASAPSGRAAYMSFLPSGRAAYIGFLPSGRAAYIGFLPSGRAAYIGFLPLWRATYIGFLPLWRATYKSFKLPNLSSCTIDITQHALKGQKLLAQGNALGIMSVSNAPCKGKSFKIHRIKMEIRCDM